MPFPVAFWLLSRNIHAINSKYLKHQKFHYLIYSIKYAFKNQFEKIINKFSTSIRNKKKQTLHRKNYPSPYNNI